MLPDGKHILYVTSDNKNNRHLTHVARLNDPGSVKDLIASDSRVLYTASVANSGTGYLMFLRDGNLLAQPFDPQSLRVTGEVMPVVNKVYGFGPTGGADFSTSNSGTLAYQSFSSRSQLVWVDREGRQWKRFQMISTLPERDQKAVVRLINSLVAAVPVRKSGTQGEQHG